MPDGVESVAAGIMAWQRALAESDVDVVLFAYGVELDVLIIRPRALRHPVRVERGWRPSPGSPTIVQERLRVVCVGCEAVRGWVWVKIEPPADTLARVLTEGLAHNRCACSQLRATREAMRRQARGAS